MVPLSLHGYSTSQYNALADAFLHLRLWIMRFPAAIIGPEPLNPAHLPSVLGAYGDDSLYHDHLYLSWGPAPVLVLLVPLHMLGYEPSASVIMAPFAIAGLGFALITLRIVLRVIGGVSMWIIVLAALTLGCASVVPELLRASEVYHEAIVGGYCFAMAGIWLAVSAVVDQRASPMRLGLMSLCFGLAAGSRPTLGLTVLILVPVYWALKARRSRLGLFLSLAAPVGICFLLLAVYNYARYGDPLEIGTLYQIGDPVPFYLGEVSFLPIGMWGYMLTPPRLSALFPFLSVVGPHLSYPLKLPVHYEPIPSPTGGLLPTTPIAIFVLGLPIVHRRRPELLGALGSLLIAMVIAGLGILLFLAYEFPTSAERYEADYATLFVFGAVVVWLALSARACDRRRMVIRVGGGVLAIWGCVTGLAIACNGLENHQSTWRTLSMLGSPLSTAIATVVGHPILARVDAPGAGSIPEEYGLGTDISNFWLSPGSVAYLTVISPDSRSVMVEAEMEPGAALSANTNLEAQLSGPGVASHIYRVPAQGGYVRITAHLKRGINQLALRPLNVAKNRGRMVVSSTESEQGIPLMVISKMHIAGS